MLCTTGDAGPLLLPDLVEGRRADAADSLRPAPCPASCVIRVPCGVPDQHVRHGTGVQMG